MCGGASCVLPALAAVPGVPVASRRSPGQGRGAVWLPEG